jgi:hypothetical protein
MSFRVPGKDELSKTSCGGGGRVRGQVGGASKFDLRRRGRLILRVPFSSPSRHCRHPFTMIKVHHFVTTIWTRRPDTPSRLSSKPYYWVDKTWLAKSYGYSRCRPGDLKKWLRAFFGSSAVGSNIPAPSPFEARC